MTDEALRKAVAEAISERLQYYPTDRSDLNSAARVVIPLVKRAVAEAQLADARERTKLRKRDWVLPLWLRQWWRKNEVELP